MYNKRKKNFLPISLFILVLQDKFNLNNLLHKKQFPSLKILLHDIGEQERGNYYEKH